MNAALLNNSRGNDVSGRARTLQPIAAVRCVIMTTAVLALFGNTHAATVPSGYTETLVAGGLSNPTAMALAPDGRVFVSEQAGALRVIKNNTLLPTPFTTVTVNWSGERGLLGVAFDPNFEANQFVYVYYTATSPAVHNRVSRFTANGDVAVPGSETILLDLDNLSSATNHNGGALAFGGDGKLYIAVGDNATGSNSQSLNTVKGKMLRINADGTIPTDNPFYGSTSGIYRSIWSLGLRNPFTFAFDAPTGSMFINDVGENTWEEINDGGAGWNHGWPATEGPTSDPNYKSPRFAYNHTQGTPQGCAITGGAFYSPQTTQFPGDYGMYFFADYCNGWIYKLNPSTNTATAFASGISSPVGVQVSPDGFLYYLAKGTGAVLKIGYAPGAGPTITAHPTDKSAPVGGSAVFTASASGSAPLSYQWQRDAVDIGGANANSYTVSPVQTTDDGARFRVVVSNGEGSVTSNEAMLHVTTNAAPTATIAQPAVGTLYTAGSNVAVSGTGTDPEDGALAGSAFSWVIQLHHDAHAHPFLSGSGIKSGNLAIPNTGETSANVYYRIELTVTDSNGQTSVATRDIHPRTANITLATNPSGLQLTLDGQPVTTPYTFTGVVGFLRSIGVTTPYTFTGVTYDFTSWSDNGAATHNITTPSANTTYTATLTARGTSPSPPAPPTGLTANAVSSTQINLSWTDASANETGFRIERCRGAGCTNFAQISTAGANATTVNDTGLIASTRYRYRVRAYNATGNSAYGNLAEATTQAATTIPAAPTGLTASVVSGRINLSWNDNSNNENGFRIDRCVVSNGACVGTPVQVGQVSVGVNTFANTTVTAGTTYGFGVRAFNTAGNSAYSNGVLVTAQ
jgi:glucose/arabinose dehydrogenase